MVDPLLHSLFFCNVAHFLIGTRHLQYLLFTLSPSFPFFCCLFPSFSLFPNSSLFPPSFLQIPLSASPFFTFYSLTHPSRHLMALFCLRVPLFHLLSSSLFPFIFPPFSFSFLYLLFLQIFSSFRFLTIFSSCPSKKSLRRRLEGWQNSVVLLLDVSCWNMPQWMLTELSNSWHYGRT